MSLSVYDFDSFSEVSELSFVDPEVEESDAEEYHSSSQSSLDEPGASSASFARTFLGSIASLASIPRRKKPSRITLAAKLWDRESLWSTHLKGSRWTVGALLDDWGTCKRVRLRDIVENEHSMIRDEHVFLGFTQDGRYLLSYTKKAVDPTVNGSAYLPGSWDDMTYVTCALHFWTFRPFSKSTRIVHTSVLFEGVCRIRSNFKCIVSQWLDVHSRFVVMGFWTTGRSGDSDPERHVCMSVIAVPTPGIWSPLSDIHISPISFYSPVVPQISLAIHNLIALQCGELLLLYWFILNGQQREEPRTDSDFSRFLGTRKRSYEENEQNASVCETKAKTHKIHSDGAIIREAFLPDGSSHLTDPTGVPRDSHPLDNILRHVGAPRFSGPAPDFHVEMATVRTDILVETVWELLKHHTGFTIHTRQVHFCLMESVHSERQEITMKGCLFADGMKRGATRPQMMTFIIPFFLYLNVVSGDCVVRVAEFGKSPVSLEKTDAQSLFRLVDRCVQPLDGIREPPEVARTLHSMNNFNVNRGESLRSLVSPDGIVEVTL